MTAVPVAGVYTPDQAETSFQKAETVSRWRPIATAPEFQDVLVCVTHNTCEGEWETIQWVDFRAGPYVWPIFADRIDIPFPPTHWMPLPAPPEISA